MGEEEEDSLQHDNNAPVTLNNTPYDTAIEGYKSFAKSKLSSEWSDSDRGSSLSTSASTSSMSPAPVSSRNNDSKNDDAWEEKIETFIQPARRVSNEVSDKMKQKLANFETSNSSKEQTPVRMIEPDNSFKDKLKAFKTIESSISEGGVSGAKMPGRRESEPSLMKPRGVLSSNYARSTSSSFMNTTHNNKFFQQNSLGSEKDEDSLSSANNQLLDDALEESFNDILEDNLGQEGDSGVVFSADDFIPGSGSLPLEKPPPLPAVPPPDMIHQQKSNQMENEIDKQEREIIESLEREEKKHKKDVASHPSGYETSSVVRTSVSKSQSHLHNGKQDPVPRKKSETSKDYNKHWLIQEAEQRRISEAKQKQTSAERIENVNNNNGYHNNSGHEKRAAAHNNVSDNIYANVDAANLSYKPHSGFSAPDIPQIPGPQVPPRLGSAHAGAAAGQQDRKLSVSGKKKCSHCGEELGRGAAMIIESLKLYYPIRCFKCCVCSILLGNGETGTDVRVRNNRLHCQNCYSNDEGLKFSKV